MDGDVVINVVEANLKARNKRLECKQKQCKCAYECVSECVCVCVSE